MESTFGRDEDQSDGPVFDGDVEAGGVDAVVVGVDKEAAGDGVDLEREGEGLGFGERDEKKTVRSKSANRASTEHRVKDIQRVQPLTPQQISPY